MTGLVVAKSLVRSDLRRLHGDDVLWQPLLFSFNHLGSRQVLADSFRQVISAAIGGMLFLGQVDEGLGISRSLARCFYDARNPLFMEHSVRELVAQRLLGLAAGL